MAIRPWWETEAGTADRLFGDIPGVTNPGMISSDGTTQASRVAMQTPAAGPQQEHIYKPYSGILPQNQSNQPNVPYLSPAINNAARPPQQAPQQAISYPRPISDPRQPRSPSWSAAHPNTNPIGKSIGPWTSYWGQSGGQRGAVAMKQADPFGGSIGGGSTYSGSKSLIGVPSAIGDVRGSGRVFGRAMNQRNSESSASRGYRGMGQGPQQPQQVQPQQSPEAQQAQKIQADKAFLNDRYTFWKVQMGLSHEEAQKRAMAEYDNRKA